jgi:hypothetical protein
MTVNFNPYVQTNAAGSFVIESDGMIVGTAMPDPAARFALSGGWLATTETLPMFGGVGISESIPNESTAPPMKPAVALGGIIARATAAANLTGFSVFDQNYANFNMPQSPVPVSNNGMFVSFYRLGSGIRVALAIDPALITLEGGLITQQVSWDYTNQKIIAFATTALPVKILKVKATNCMVPVYTSATGFVTWNYNGAAAEVQI